MSSPSDSLLLRGCIAGDQESWEVFVKRFSRLVYHSITKTFSLYNQSLSPEDIEDIFNGVFLSFVANDYGRLRKFESRRGCSLPSWIRLLSVRQTIDFLRKQRPFVSLYDENGGAYPLMDTLADQQPSAERQLEMDEKGEMIRKTIEALPPADKVFLRLYYERQLPPERIARIMHISVNTVYSRKKRVQERMRQLLESGGRGARNSGRARLLGQEGIS
jgi:RNA polymerase sigma-70 factor (ECF subfamily)